MRTGRDVIRITARRLSGHSGAELNSVHWGAPQACLGCMGCLGLIMIILGIIAFFLPPYAKVSSQFIYTPRAVVEESYTSPHRPLKPMPKLAARRAVVPLKTTGCRVVGNQAYWRNYIRNLAGATAKERRWLYAVADCESHFYVCAYNKRSSASGLFQFIPKWHPEIRSRIWDGRAQVAYALKKYRLGGAGLWNASRSCWQSKI